MTEDDRLLAGLLAARAPEHAELVEAMMAQGIAVASQAALLHAIRAYEAGNVSNGYQMARALGRSRPESQRGAATSALAAVRAYAGPPDSFLH